MTPGRRTALVIGVPVCLALIGGTAYTLVADLGQASYPVHYTFPASAKRVAVSVDAGQLTLTQADTDRATVTGTAHYSLIRTNPSSTTDGDQASYSYHCHAVTGNCSLDATVTVPAGMTASVSTDGGNAAVAGTTGTVSLDTGGGNLAAGNVSGPVTLSTDGGNIQATAIRSADVTASSGGGNIEIHFTAVPRDVNINTAGGDITVIVPYESTGYHVTAHTDGGATTESVYNNSHSKYEITATSGGGNILIEEAAK